MTKKKAAVMVAVRYSTPDSSWVSVYSCAGVAEKHALDNMRIHHGDASEEDMEVFEAAVSAAFDSFDSIVECSDWSAEIEYGVEIINS